MTSTEEILLKEMRYIADQFLRAQDERLAFAFARAIEAHHGITEGVA